MEYKRDFNLECPHHTDSDLQYFQIKNIQNNKEDCAEEDETFNSQNYQQFNKLFKCKQGEFNPNWPPLGDSDFLKNLNQLLIDKDDIKQREIEIRKFFENLRVDILKELEKCQNSCIDQARQLIINKPQLIEKYEELSQINVLKQILANAEIDMKEKEKQYQTILEGAMLQSSFLIQSLTQILHAQQNQFVFNCEDAISIKQSILDKINNINFFTPQQITVHPTFNNIIGQLYLLDVNPMNETLKFKETNNKEGITKNKKNQIRIKNQNQIMYTGSDTVLLEDYKYVFRLEVDSIERSQLFDIGLIYDKKGNQNYSLFSCELQYINSAITIDQDNQKYYQQIKGTGLKLSDEKVIEMRVCLKDKVLEFLDYPHYSCKLAIAEQCKHIFNYKDYRLYIGLGFQKQKLKLRESYIVNQFE